MLFRTFFWMAGSFLALILLAVLLGLVLPREHQVDRRLHLKAPPEKVWTLVAEHAQDPTWRSQLKSTTRVSDRKGHPVWEDAFANGEKIAYETTERVEGRKLVRTIVDQKLFGGTWTYEVQPESAGTMLSLSEHGWVSIPFRAVARFVFGHASTLELYLKDVARHFGETTSPEPG
jgi:uncharacterized protein YndB with AHSA1/START domain